MEISRLTFRKETKEKMEKPLTAMEKGRLMWEKIVEAERDGRLQQAKSRVDVASIAGYTDDKRGYSWASNMIKRGAILETIYGPGEYTYAIGNAPKFEYTGNKTRSKKVKPVEKAEPVEHTEPVVLSRAYVPTENGKVVIECGGMRITMENVGVEYVKEIIKAIK